jgi:superfamily II DNA helicase RecQ
MGNMVTYINDLLFKYSDKKSRVLVFCLTKPDADFVVKVVKCELYHSGRSDNDKHTILKRWNDGVNLVLATTSALGSSLD